MKESSLLTFNNTPKDLSAFGEYWISESIAEREEKILAEIRAWHIREHHLDTEEAVRRLEEHMPYALLPSKNIRLIREVSFPIGDAVTIDDLKEIIPKLREKFVIDCFQAAIDRRQHVARMVFDWYDRSQGSCVYLYPNKRVRLSVFLVRELDLPRPDGYEMWLRHFLQEDYKENPGIFQKMAEHVKHVRLGRRGYNIVRDALQYAELVCKNLIK